MRFSETTIHGLYVVRPDVHQDARGCFVESYRREWFSSLPSPPGEMVQGNRSDKISGSLIGLHFHLKQSDYWFLTRGSARFVMHDLRAGSPTCGVTWQETFHSRDNRGVLIPLGVAHGFSALTDITLTYLIDRYYDPSDEKGIAWDDPDVGADWGVSKPILSQRDRENPKRSVHGFVDKM